MHKTYKLLFFCLLIFFCFQINSAYAIKFDAQVIDQIGFTQTDIQGDSIGKLIEAIYTYSLGIVGILATIVMMYGGVLYITAAGNASKMDNAKQWIFSSLTGLILALSSYTLLYMINPNLLTMTAINPIKPKIPPGDKILTDSNVNTTIGDADVTCSEGNCMAGCQNDGYETGSCVDNKCWCKGKVADPYYITYTSPETCGEMNCDSGCQTMGYTAGTCSHYRICECTKCINTNTCPKQNARR